MYINFNHPQTIFQYTCTTVSGPVFLNPIDPLFHSLVVLNQPVCISIMGPKNLHFRGFMVNNLVFRLPKPLFFMVWGAHGIYIYSYIYIMYIYTYVSPRSARMNLLPREEPKGDPVSMHWRVSFIRMPLSNKNGRRWIVFVRWCYLYLHGLIYGF